MHPSIFKISPLSEYYIASPSTLAKKLYLYPLSLGYYIYEPDYHVTRNSFDSFLIMYIIKGSCSIVANNRQYHASAGQYVLIDCYTPHQYGSDCAWETLWIHFDGTLARAYFEEITQHYGHVLSPGNPNALNYSFEKLINYFRNSTIVESKLSRHITNILNELLIPSSSAKSSVTSNHAISDSIAYINEHFSEPLTLEDLAAKANLSPFHFTRLFSERTGVTPHQYLINTRIAAAKFMLRSSDASIKDIAFSTGFHSESSFCSSFKKHENITPRLYRNGENQ